MSGDAFATLMKGAAGQEIMRSTNFNELFDKLRQMIAMSLDKTTLILEDKVII